MITKELYLLILIQLNYPFLSSFEKTFCDNAYKDSLLAFGGIFSIDDTIFVTRRYSNTEPTIVWRFRLKMIGTEDSIKNNRIEIIDMSSHQIKSLFPGLGFEYFVSGFAITDTNSCNDRTEECVNTSHMKNLTVILGPINSNSRQPYVVYRFNGDIFKSVDPNIDVIPLGLDGKGYTTHWLSPKTFITITFRHKEKQIIGFNYGDKTINKLEFKKFTKHKIGNRYWNILVSNITVHSFYYNLIEIKISETQRKVLLITQQMVYELTDDNKLKEVMHPWKLFGCKSIKISLRSGIIDRKVVHSIHSDPNSAKFKDLGIQLFIQLVAANLTYFILLFAILWFIK